MINFIRCKGKKSFAFKSLVYIVVIELIFQGVDIQQTSAGETSGSQDNRKIWFVDPATIIKEYNEETGRSEAQAAANAGLTGLQGAAVSQAAATAQDDSAAENVPPIELIEKNDNGATFVSFSACAWVNQISAGGTTYDMLELVNGRQSAEGIGAPELPCYSKFVAVPQGAAISLSIKTTRLKLIKGQFNMVPLQPPMPDTVGVTAPAFTIDKGAYAVNNFINSNKIVTISDDVIIRGKRYLCITYHPILYNPSKKGICAVWQVKWNLKYSYPNGTHEPDPSGSSDGSGTFVSEGDFAINAIPGSSPQADTDGQGYKVYGNGADYLIITHDNFYNEILPLADWKKKKGYLVKVTKLSEIGSNPTAAEITNYIKTAYDTWSPKPLYLLLVGDYNYLPFARTSGTWTDLYYAAIDGNDIFADILTGRIPVTTAQECKNIVNKILMMETNPPVLKSFYNKALIAGYFQDISGNDPADGYEGRIFLETCEGVKDYLEKNSWTVETSYVTETSVTPRRYNRTSYSSLLHPNGTSYIGTQTYLPMAQATGKVTSVINSGVCLVQHRDHGAETQWGEPSYYNSNISALTNNGLPTWVNSTNCLTGSIQYSGGDCFAEAFLKKENSGAYCVTAATDVSYSWHNDYLIHGFYQCLFPDFYLTLKNISGYKTDLSYSGNRYGNGMHFGQMLNFGKMLMYDKIGSGSVTTIEFEMFHLYGCPEQEPRMSEPKTLVVAHPQSVAANQPVNFDVTVTKENQPLKGARISLISTDEFYAGVTDTQGKVNFSFTPKNSGGLGITVTYKDAIPYEAVISEVTDPHNLTVNSGTGSGQYYPGTAVNIQANPPQSGMRFDKWTGDTTTVSNVNAPATSLTMPAKDTAVTATYRTGKYLITVNAVNGSVPVNPAGYNYGDVVSLTAQPNSGYHFLRWTGDVPAGHESDNPLSITINSDVSLQAQFSMNTYLITPNAETGGSINPASPVELLLGASQTFTITANTGYSVSDVIVDGISKGAQSSYAFTNIAANHSIVAKFDPAKYVLTVVNGSGSGTYSHGTAVPIQANPPAANKRFSQWSGNTANVASVTSASTTINMLSAAAVTANYSDAIYAITASAGSNGSIQPSGAVSVVSGTDQSFTITANPGYHISEVSINGSGLSLDSSTQETFTHVFKNVTQDWTIQAKFEQIDKNATADPISGKNLIRVYLDGKSASPFSRMDIASGKNGVYLDIVATQQDMAAVNNLGYRINVIPVNGTDMFQNTGADYDYHSYTEMKASLDAMETAHPAIAKVQSIGKTYEGRDIWALKISDNVQSQENEKRFFIVGNHHAREIMTPEIPIYIAQYLVDKYASDPEAQAIVNNWELWFVPSINPDGHIIVENNDIWQRKNTRPPDGVDLNRNYGHTWGYDNNGSSSNSYDETYRGTAAFSEPETQAIRDFLQGRDFDYVFDYHSYGELILFPWGHIDSVSPDDALFKQLSADYKKDLTTYTPGQPGHVLYNVNGDSIDWEYGEQTAKHKITAFCFEVNSSSQGGFRPPVSMIQPTCEMHLKVFLKAAHVQVQTYNITATATAGGSIDPSGTVNVVEGENKTFTMIPQNGYYLAGIDVDGQPASPGPNNTYTFTDVRAAHTINARFDNRSFNLTVNNGTGSGQYKYGQTVSISANPPSSGYRFDKWTGDTETVAGINNPQATLTMPAKDITVTAANRAGTYQLSVSAQSGSVSKNPDKPQGYNYGDTVSLTAAPASNYHFTFWSGNVSSGHEIDNPLSVTVDNDKSFEAHFSIDTYTIVATATSGGTISPAGNVEAKYGSDKNFIIMPAVGYHIKNLIVDGTSINPVSIYTFANVTANHTINAVFEPTYYTITAGAGANGTITPEGAVSVLEGSNQGFSITPNAGYAINSVTIDNAPIDLSNKDLSGVTTYVFTNVRRSYTIQATFKERPLVITATAGAHGSITPSGAVVVEHGADQAFTIAADSGYRIATVIINGCGMSADSLSDSPGNLETFTHIFKNVLCDSSISAEFESVTPNFIGNTDWRRQGYIRYAFLNDGVAHGDVADKSIKYAYQFSAPAFDSHGTYDTIRMTGMELWDGNPGEPIMPFKTVRLAIPYGYDASKVKVTPAANLAASDGTHKLDHAQKPIAYSYTGNIVPTPPDAVIYGSDDPYPAAPCGDAFVQDRKGYKVLILNLFPVQYKPLSGAVSYSDHMDVEVELVRSSGTNQMLRYDPLALAEMRKSVDNPGELDSYIQPARKPDATYEYVIITTNTLKNSSATPSLKDLAALKQARGMTTKIVTVETDIYPSYQGKDNQDKIRNFIIDHYKNYGTKFIVLGGNETLIPPRMFYVDGTSMPSDMYFGCLDGTFDYDNDGKYAEPNDGPNGGEVDLYAEVQIGRISAANETEASNHIRKIIAYENSSDDYLKKVSEVGEYLWPGTWGKDYLEEIRLGASTNGYTTVGFENSPYAAFFDTTSNLYEKDGNWGKTQLFAIMNGGVHVMNHLGHCNYDYAMKVYSSDLAGLTNTKYFFAYSQGCMPGGFDNSKCYAEVLTTMEKGAFAAVMNARYGWGMPGSTDGPSQHYDRQFWDALLSEGIAHIGSMNSDSKEDNVNKINEECMRWCCYELNLFGDPETSIKTSTVPTYTITATASTGGSIDPSGEVPVKQGDSKTFTMTPGTGYYMADLKIDGVSVTPNSTYTFTNVTAPHSIHAVFENKILRLTVNNGSGSGTSYRYNEVVTITANPPSAGQRFDKWTGDTGKVANVNSAATTITMQDNYTVTAAYRSGGYLLTVSSQNGTVTKSPEQPPQGYNYGTVVTVTPSAGQNYHFSRWSGDVPSGHEIDNPLSITVNDDRILQANFSLDTYTIVATMGEGGGISPSGAVEVEHGSNRTFTITPNVGYHIDKIFVDGSQIAVSSTYTFANITANHTINAVFARTYHTITASAGANGTITPEGSITVPEGSNQVFTITPNSGYNIKSVTVDSVPVDLSNRDGSYSTTYVFANVRRSYNIQATFKERPLIITATAGAHGSITPSGAVVVEHGADQAFTITADSGYRIATVIINGCGMSADSLSDSPGNLETFTHIFKNVVCDSSICAEFESVTPNFIGNTDWRRQGYIRYAFMNDGVSHGDVADKSIKYSYQFSAPAFDAHGTYDTIRMTGMELWAGNPGEPIMPFKTVRLAIPYGYDASKVKVTPAANLTASAGTHKLDHAQLPIRYSYTGTITPTPPDTAIYGSDDPYPAAPCGDAFVQERKGYKVLILNLFPVQYKPLSGAVSYSDHMDVEVELVRSSGTNQMLRYDPLALAEMRKSVDNPGELDSYIQPATKPDETYEYVIITTNTLKNSSATPSLKDLAALKQARGMTTKIVTVETDVYPSYQGKDNQDKIRNFIIDHYKNYGTKFIVLGGNETLIPPRMFYVDGTSMPSDMYFGCLDGTFDYDNDGKYAEPNDGPNGGEVDLYAEVQIGRISAANETEASNHIRKIIAYENSSDDYLKKFSMIGELLWSSSNTWAKPYLEEIRLGASTNGYTTVGIENSPHAAFFDTTNNLYEKDANWGKTQLFAIMNGGVHVMNHLGHCNYDYAMKVYSSDLAGLTNTKYFFAYSQGCMPGGFDNGKCFAEVLTTMEKGAFAAVMNARYGYGAHGSTNGPSQHYDRQFWDALLSEGMAHIGSMNSDSKEDNVNKVNGSYMRWCLYELNLFGDPETSIKTSTVPTYTITATASTGGSIDPSGEVPVKQGDSKAFTLTPSTGYYLADLKIDGASVTPNGTYTFTNVTAPHSIHAVFENRILRLTVNNGSGSGTSYRYNEVVTITANPPSAGQRFDKWTGDTGKVANVNSPTTTITMQDNYTVTAAYRSGGYLLTVNSQNGTVTKSPEQPPQGYDYGTVVALTPSAGQNFHFSRWSGDVPSGHEIDNPLSITVNDDRILQANFSLDTYTIVATMGEGGGISPSGAVEVEHGSNKTFIITPNVGYHIKSILVDGSPAAVSSTYTFTNIITNHTINAVFEPTYHTIAASAGANGSITPEGIISVLEGSNKGFVISADNGYHINSVTVSGGMSDQLSGNGPVVYNFCNVRQDYSIHADFAINTYTLTTTAGHGAVIKNPDKPIYRYGEQVILEARPDTGYSFVKWTGDMSGSTNPVSVTMDNNKQITATFGVNPPKISYIKPVSAPYTDVPNNILEIYGSQFGAAMGSLSKVKFTCAGGNTYAGIFWQWSDTYIKCTAPALGEGSYTVTVLVNGEVSNDAAFTVIPAAPGAPSLLKATPISLARIDLAWLDNSGNETGFVIQRKIDSGNFVNLQTVNANVAAYSDTNLLTGAHDYTYRVYALNGTGQSGYSNEAAARIYAGNNPPVFNFTDKTVMLGDSLNFYATAQDPDSPGTPQGTLVYGTPVGLPPGATVNSSDRYFKWTPTAANKGVYEVTFSVSDCDYTITKTIIIQTSMLDKRDVFKRAWQSYMAGFDICKNKIAASQYDGSYYRLYLYDIETGAETALSSSTYHSKICYMDDDKIVWTEDRGAYGQDVYAYKISTGQKINLSVNNYDTLYAVAVDGDHIAYLDKGQGGWQTPRVHYQISIYNVSSGQTIIIPPNGNPRQDICIYGNTVIWDEKSGEDFDLYMYNIASGTTTPLVTAAGDQTEPFISGDKVAWNDKRNGNYDIYMYDLTMQVEKPVVTLTTDQKNPKIHGDKILWDDYRKADSYGTKELYMYDIPKGEEVRITAGVSLKNGYNTYAVEGDLIALGGVIDASTYGIWTYNMTDRKKTVIESEQVRSNYRVGDISGGKISYLKPLGNYDYQNTVYLYDLRKGEGINFNFATEYVKNYENIVVGANSMYVTMARIKAAPRIISLKPASVSPGSLILINGRGFGISQGASQVTFYNGINAAEVISWSDTDIICRVPQNAQTGPVKVITSEGTSNGAGATITPLYTLTVNKGSGSGVYEKDARINIVADAPLPLGSFSHWSGDVQNVENINSANTYINMRSNAVVTANYVTTDYFLDVSADNGRVVKSPDLQKYAPGAAVTLTAIGNEGYSFSNWSGDLTGNSNPVVITMNSNKVITANFSSNTYSLSIVSQNGQVTRVPDLAAYPHGTQVTLTAEPAPGFSFTNWTGDVTGSQNPVTITMDSNKNVTANYSQ